MYFFSLCLIFLFNPMMLTDFAIYPLLLDIVVHFFFLLNRVLFNDFLLIHSLAEGYFSFPGFGLLK